MDFDVFGVAAGADMMKRNNCRPPEAGGMFPHTDRQ